MLSEDRLGEKQEMEGKSLGLPKSIGRLPKAGDGQA